MSSKGGRKPVQQKSKERALAAKIGYGVQPCLVFTFQKKLLCRAVFLSKLLRMHGVKSRTIHDDEDCKVLQRTTLCRR